MNFFNLLRRGLHAESYKYRSTFLWWFVLLAPAFIPLINGIAFVRRGEYILERGGTAWGMMMQYSNAPAYLLFPFFVFIVALYINQVEWSSNTWKLIYTQPMSRLSVFFSKWIFFLSILLISLMLYAGFLVLAGKITHLLRPSLGFDEPLDLYVLFAQAFRMFLATLGLASIQFYLSQKTKNIMLPLGVGIAGIISYLIVVKGWEYAAFHPYGFPDMVGGFAAVARTMLLENMQPIYLSLGLCTILTGIAAMDLHHKRIY